jgi:CBS domain-containing protein
MQVQEIITRGAEVIDPNTTIRDAARKMRKKNRAGPTTLLPKTQCSTLPLRLELLSC